MNYDSMKQSILLLLLISTFLTAKANRIDSTSLEIFLAENEIVAQAGEKGLYHTIEREGSGAYPKAGDYIMVAYTGKLLNGNIFDESDPKEPFVFQLGYRQVIRGWEKGIPLFRVGSKGTLYVPSPLGYGKTGAGKAIPPNADLMFEVEVLQIMDINAYDQYMVALEEKERRAFERQQKEQFSQDKKLIHEYAVSKKLKTKRLSSGMSYALKRKGKGDYVKKGDLLTVHYEGRLLDGTVFDSSYDSKEPFSFVLGKGKVIEGWEEGLLQFKKGSEGWLLIPSRMAYGPRGIEEGKVSIPANSVLVFKIKILKVASSQQASK